jgi:hypothetical protein
MSGQHGHEQGPSRSHSSDTHTLAPQVGDAADTLPAEQFVAADMDASQQRDRIASVDRRNIIY